MLRVQKLKPMVTITLLKAEQLLLMLFRISGCTRNCKVVADCDGSCLKLRPIQMAYPLPVVNNTRAVCRNGCSSYDDCDGSCRLD